METDKPIPNCIGKFFANGYIILGLVAVSWLAGLLGMVLGFQQWNWVALSILGLAVCGYAWGVKDCWHQKLPTGLSKTFISGRNALPVVMVIILLLICIVMRSLTGGARVEAMPIPGQETMGYFSINHGQCKPISAALFYCYQLVIILIMPIGALAALIANRHRYFSCLPVDKQ